jgi:hypothetical protein
VTVSPSGTLAYVAAAQSMDAPTLAWVSTDGTLTAVGELPVGSAAVDVSPDGTLAVVGTATVPTKSFLWDMVRQVPTGLEVEGSIPRWHPDGRHVALSRGRELLLLDVDDGSETVLVSEPGGRSPSFAADGSTVAYAVRGKSGSQDIFALLPGDTTPQAVVATAAEEHSPALSPDGRWLAYVEGSSGGNEVYIARFPSGTGRRRVTTKGGNQPLWRRDGRALFFRENLDQDTTDLVRSIELRVVAVAPGDTLDLGAPQTLFLVSDPSAALGSNTFGNWGAAYHATPDGSRFLMVYRPPLQPLTEIVVVQNWLEELKRLVPAN